MARATLAGLIEGLPGRYLPHLAEIDARYRLRIDRTRRDVVVSAGECRIERVRGAADVEICTDSETWRAMDAGRLSGIEAFAERRLTVRGSIEKSLHFEPLFERPARGGMRYSLERVKAGRMSISTLFAGPEDAPPLLLIHGLGATKASWLTIVPALARRYRVIAIDLPGFGASTKPLARYDAPWFAERVFDFLDALGYSRVFLTGNSMGGRVAMEMALAEPYRVASIACLCPATPFNRRPLLWLARVTRPELGVIAGRLPRAYLIDSVRQMFFDPDLLEEDWYEAAIDDFLRTWRSPSSRMAFFAAARNIYLDEGSGETGFWGRLAQMSVPALYIYGKHDTLISHRFGQKIRKTIPHAEVKVWNDCGHVPQIEFPERTATALLRFFGAERAERPLQHSASG